MKDNKDYETAGKWWWVVYPMAVDANQSYDELYIYNSWAERIYWQPAASTEEVVRLEERYCYELTGGKFFYLDDYSFVGELVNTENEMVTFQDIKIFYKTLLIKEIDEATYPASVIHGIYRSPLHHSNIS